MRGGGHGQEVERGVEADGADRAPDRREALGEVGIAVASSHMWSRPRSMQRRVIARADDVARREVGERVLLGHEREAVVVAQDRALARAAPPTAAAAGSTGSRARWGGTA